MSTTLTKPEPRAARFWDPFRVARDEMDGKRRNDATVDCFHSFYLLCIMWVVLLARDGP